MTMYAFTRVYTWWASLRHKSFSIFTTSIISGKNFGIYTIMKLWKSPSGTGKIHNLNGSLLCSPPDNSGGIHR